MNKRALGRFGLCMLAALLAWPAALKAEEYPSRTVHIIVGAQPGGGTDTVARLIAEKLSEKWGQAVVVDNRPGAEGIVGAETTANSPPDGYTLVLVNNNFTITPNFYTLKYDPVKSFAPVALVGIIPDLLLVNPSVVPVKTVAELVEYVKARPGQLNFGSNGKGSTQFFEMTRLAKLTGMEMTGITYKGGAPALVALLGGETQMSFTAISNARPHVEAGKLTALAVSTKKRVELMPDVPSIAESIGAEDFDFSVWIGLLAPAGTPGDIIAKIHADVGEVVASDAYKKQMADLGGVPRSSPTDEFVTLIGNELKKWKELTAASAK